MSIKSTDKTYYDITGQRLKNYSRLNIYNTFRITETNQFFLNHFRYYEIISDVKNDNRYFDLYDALEEDWWDNISYQHYGTPQYWYLLCELNDVVNPYEQLTPGLKIKVLKKTYFYDLFKSMKEVSRL